MTRDDLNMISEPLRIGIEANRRAIEANGIALVEASEKLDARNARWTTSFWAPVSVASIGATIVAVLNHFWR